MRKLYEVKKFGITVEWTNSRKEADEAFKDTAPGECFLFGFSADGNKILLAKK